MTERKKPMYEYRCPGCGKAKLLLSPKCHLSHGCGVAQKPVGFKLVGQAPWGESR